MYNLLRLASLSSLLWQITTDSLNSTDLKAYHVASQLVSQVEKTAYRSSKKEKKKGKQNNKG